MPKEMLPIVDKPTIQYIVEEAVRSGIEDIIIVTGRSKRAIEDHFDKSEELELFLKERNKGRLLSIVEDVAQLANIHYVRQKEPLGLGHAVWCARKFIGSEPFAVLLGDMLVDSDKPCLKQLLDVYAERQAPIIAVETVAWEETSKYGIVGGVELDDRLLRIERLVEKPPSNPLSNAAIIGRYVLEPSVFDRLETTPRGAGGEIQLTDALQQLASCETMYAYRIEGKLYDVGDKMGFLKATVELACKDADLQAPFLAFLKYRFGSGEGGGMR